MEWFGFGGNEILQLYLKQEQMSIQRGIQKYGDKGKNSAMKKIKNLTAKNDCFGKINYDSITQRMKNKALPLLMFMVMKRNGELKSRGCTNGSYQRVHTEKSEVSSPIPDFYTFKYICAIIAKELRDVATVDLPSFFFQTEIEEDDKILLKITGAVALLLVESNPEK